MTLTWTETVYEKGAGPEWMPAINDRMASPGVRAWYEVVAGPAETTAWWVNLNPLDDDEQSALRELIDFAPAGATICCWSGTLGDALFAPAPMNWIGAGMQRLIAFLEDVGPVVEERTIRLWLQPHVRHVLSDVPSCISLLRTIGALGEGGTRAEGSCHVGLAVCPASLFEPGMLVHAHEHLGRIYAALGRSASVVILSDVGVDANADRVVEMREGAGASLTAEAQRSFVEEFVPSTTPIIRRRTPVDAPFNSAGG